MTENAQALRTLLTEWWQPPEELLGTLPRGGVTLTYLGHADTTRALIEADPEWTWEPMATHPSGEPVVDHDEGGRPVGLWIRLTVCGVTRPAYGSCKPGAPEPVKELIGDAIRNGAMRFGVAGGLWSRADRPVVDEQQVEAMVKVAKDAGLSPEDARAIIQRVAGVGASRDVPADRYAAVIEAMRVEGNVRELVA